MMEKHRIRRTIITLARSAIYLISLCLFQGCGPGGDRILEEIVEQSYSIDSNASISISNQDGSIQIYGAKTDKIKIEAIKKAYRSEALKAISVHVFAEPGAVSIETSRPPRPFWGFSDRSGTVDYVIVVPESASISRLELANGEVLLEEMRSPSARAHLGSGRLFAHNCFGNLTLSVSTGNLALVWDWWEENPFAIEAMTEDGNTFAYIPGDASFHLTAKAGTGKIANDFMEQQDRSTESITRIDTVVGQGAKAAIKLEAKEGNIKIAEHNP
jgi:hypothetical protein